MSIIQNVEEEYNQYIQGANQYTERLPESLSRGIFFDQHNLPTVECYYHKGYYISNFCRTPQCIIPLCPLCIHVHSQEHLSEGTFPIFESLEVLLNQASDHLNNELKKFKNSYYDIKKHLNTFEVHAEKTIMKIREIKKRIIDVVEQFFNGLENEVEHKQKKNIANKERDSRQLLSMIEERWNSMKQMSVTFQSGDCLTALIPYFTTTFQEDNQIYYKKIGEYINSFPTLSSEVDINQHRVSELSLFLQSIIRVQHTCIPNFVGLHQLPTTSVTESTKIKSLQGSRLKEPLRVTIPERKSQIDASELQNKRVNSSKINRSSSQSFSQSLPLYPRHPSLPLQSQQFPLINFVSPYHRF